MDRYVSDTPLPLPPSVVAGQFDAAELIFYDVDHSGASFEALVFLNSPDADIGAPLDDSTGFAGSFYIFGHGGCVGEAGHCDVPAKAKDPFDDRPLHALTPQTKVVDITEALQRTDRSGGSLHITVLPVVASAEKAQRADVLSFSAVRLVTYSEARPPADAGETAASGAEVSPLDSYWDADEEARAENDFAAG